MEKGYYTFNVPVGKETLGEVSIHNKNGKGLLPDGYIVDGM